MISCVHCTLNFCLCKLDFLGIIHRCGVYNDMKKKMVRTNLYLTETQHEVVSAMAEQRGITFSEMFRKIVDRYLEGSRESKNHL